MNSQKNTARSYERLISKLCTHFGDRELASLATEEILSFLTEVTKGNKQSTKKLRYSVLSAFFNFVKNSLDPNLQNPCDAVILRKLFKKPKPRVWKILEKEVVDEIIFRMEDSRNRLILELMARSGMRVSEVLRIAPNDIEEQKIIIREPKSGRQGRWFLFLKSC